MGYDQQFGHLSDTQLWDQVRRENRDAFQYLFKRYYDELYTYACKLVGDPSLAKDVIQELFYKIWDRKENLSQISSINAYLWVCLRRDLLKAKKRNRKMSQIGKQDLFTEAMLAFTQEDLMIHREVMDEQKAILLRALNELPERYREAIFLKFYNGMTYEEIQLIMGINYQSARNYICHGLSAMKDAVGEHPVVMSLKAVI